MHSDPKKNKEELKMEKEGFRKLSEGELDMVNGGAGEYIEPTPLRFRILNRAYR